MTGPVFFHALRPRPAPGGGELGIATGISAFGAGAGGPVVSGAACAGCGGAACMRGVVGEDGTSFPDADAWGGGDDAEGGASLRFARGGGVIGALATGAGVRPRASSGNSSASTVAPTLSIRGRVHSRVDPEYTDCRPSHDPRVDD